MKTKSVVAGLVLALIVVAGSAFKFGQVLSIGDSTGTNEFTWADPGLAPQITSGTNVYTGITTNRLFLGGTGVTNTLQVVNGIIVGIQ